MHPSEDAEGLLIDLGTTSAPTDDRSAGPAAGASRPRARFAARRHPAVILAAMTATVLAGVTASGRIPEPPRLSALDLPPTAVSAAGGPVDSPLRLAGGLLTAYDDVSNSTRAFTMTATARPWTTPAHGQVYGLGDDLAASVHDYCVDGDLAFDIRDTRDGRVRWSGKGSPLGWYSGRIALLRHQDRCVALTPAATPASLPTAVATLTVYDLASGRQVWSERVSAMVTPAMATRDRRPVVYGVRPDGGWLVRDLRSGAVLAADRRHADLPRDPSADPGTAPASAGPGDAGGTARYAMFARRDVVLLAGLEVAVPGIAGRPFALIGLDPTSMRQRWAARSGDDPGSGAWLTVVDCGPVICVNGPDGVTAVDAAGVNRWHRGDGTGTTRGVGTHWALATTNAAADDPGHEDAVLDTRSGRTVLGLGQWQVAAPTGDRDPLGPRLLLFRLTADRTWFAVLDLVHATQPSVIGWVAGQQGACVADERYVACRTPQATAAAWRLPH